MIKDNGYIQKTAVNTRSVESFSKITYINSTGFPSGNELTIPWFDLEGSQINFNSFDINNCQLESRSFRSDPAVS